MGILGILFVAGVGLAAGGGFGWWMVIWTIGDNTKTKKWLERLALVGALGMFLVAIGMFGL